MGDKVWVQMFKAPKQTKRFNLNQKVWILYNFGNHSNIVFKWRGKGRYVKGIINNEVFFDLEVKQIEVDRGFAERLGVEWYEEQERFVEKWSKNKESE